MIESTSVEPQLCRVSVLGGNTQVDVVLPTTVPIANFVPDVVALIASRNPDLSELEENADLSAQHWTLERLGRSAIDPARTLTEAEVFDGELLVLRAVNSVDAPPLFDDVIDAVARLTESSFRGWSAQAASWAGTVAAVGATAAATAMLLVAKAHGLGIASGAAGFTVGLLVLVAAALAARMYGATRPAAALTLCGLLPIAAAAAAVVPGALGAPHLLLAATVTLLVAVPARRIVSAGATVFATVVTVAVFATGAGFVTTIWHVAVAKSAPVLILAALLAVTVAPRIAVAAARLPVPPVPTVGGVIDPRDHEPRPTIEGIGAIGATALPSAAGLAVRARLANEYQTGIVFGIVAVTVLGTSVTAATATGHGWQVALLTAAVGVVLARRGPAFADLAQAGALVLGGCLAVIVPAVLAVIRDPELALPVAGALLVVAVLAVLFGVAGPGMDPSPVVQRAGEVFEYVTICLLGPLVFWIVDVYGMARNA